MSGLWAFYFFAKLYFFYRGYMSFTPMLNLLLLLAIIVPLPMAWGSSMFVAFLRGLALFVAGFLLLWRDSFLPSLSTSLSFVTNASTAPSKTYMMDFAHRYYNPREFAVLLALLVACIWVRRKGVRLTPLLLPLIFLATISGIASRHGASGDRIDTFYAQEAKRAVRFEAPPAGAPAFDILLIQICSLGWDDLDAAGLRNHPFWKNFDYLFTNYNGATSYSNPAAHRLLHAPCGQLAHEDLYRDIPKECYLLDELRRVGFRTYAAYDHDGVYGHFAEEAIKLDHADPAMPLDGLPAVEHNFEGTPIYDPYAVLEKWWRLRQADGAPRVALFYNATLLHDGAHFVKDKEWWNRDRVDRYHEAVLLLFADVQRFLDLLAASGRPVVVVFVPEHGMGLRGSRMQAAGLRDIPLPPLTMIPVAIKVINGGASAAAGSPRIIDAQVSHLALAEMLAAFIRQPSLRAADSSVLLSTLPRTPHVAENTGWKVAEFDGKFFLSGKDVRWTLLAPDAVAVPSPRWLPR